MFSCRFFTREKRPASALVLTGGLDCDSLSSSSRRVSLEMLSTLGYCLCEDRVVYDMTEYRLVWFGLFFFSLRMAYFFMMS